MQIEFPFGVFLDVTGDKAILINLEENLEVEQWKL